MSEAEQGHYILLGSIGSILEVLWGGDRKPRVFEKSNRRILVVF
jgi:hypothetical protein